ncbi:NAD(P)-binding protein [Macroventuria anomochaeta]|uniref:NAD(P)-binding protein n=1 Tax=Macroventuria anomochaeta TaxID=301207 RepID=A0ACB6RY60_9PLEO|nr:NAD(P)-binding protein [Macroventuria anomochaeta]KAF2626202.1 NAD(P)-binding protein [Macroventuria anomochaeta]
MTPPTTNKDPTQIFLLGAGELGTSFLPHISSLPNIQITVGVRSPDRYAHLRSSHIHLITIDLTSPSPALVEILSRYDVVISATGFTSTPSSLTKLASEVLSAGKQRKQNGQGRLWFFPWQWGVDYDVTLSCHSFMPLFGEQKRVRELLRSEASFSNVKWTVVSTGIFMSFLFEPFWGVVDRSSQVEGGEVTVRCLKDWEHGVTVTDVDDIGRVVGRILAGDVDAENRVLYVAGDSIRYADLTKIVEKVVGREVVREAWSVEHLQEELRKDPEDRIKKYRLVFAGDGVWWEKERTANHVLGVEMMDVGTYAKKLFSVWK